MDDGLRIPVIDLFAGPGGLGEGFSAFTPPPRAGSASARSRPGYQIALSIEKDPSAWQTLRLRSFFRQFSSNAAECDIHPQPNSESAQTGRAGRQFELGAPGSDHRDLSRRVDEAVRGSQGRWVLIGGPPCQAYSVVGRSRNKGKVGYQIETDHRSSLYRQYLRIIGG